MGIKKGFIVLADPPVPAEAESTVNQAAEHVYYTAVQKEKKLAAEVTYNASIYLLIALPTKAVILVTVKMLPASRVWSIPSTRSLVSPITYHRYEIDDDYSLRSPFSEQLYRIVTLPNLYYQTNRSESLFLETEYFFRVAGRVSKESPLDFQDESCILLWGMLQTHVPNPFFSHIAPKIFTLNLDVHQQEYLFPNGLNSLYANGIPVKGFARFPSLGSDQPAGTLLTFDWENNLLAPPEDEYIQTATGYIVTYAYLQAMLEDMNKPYEEKQYTNFTAAFSFITEDEENPATVYSILVENYGLLDFIVYEDSYSTSLAYQSVTEGLIIYVSEYSDEVDSDLGITARTILYSTMTTSYFSGKLVCFNTGAFTYAIVNRIAGIDSWGPDVSGLGYDEVVTTHTSYLNGDKIYARIGITYPERVDIDTFLPPFPSPADIFDPHSATTRDETHQSGASVAVIDQYEMSIDGPIPSNRFRFFETYYTNHKDFPGLKTRVVTTIASNYDYPVAPPYNSIAAGNQLGNGNSIDPFDTNLPNTVSWSISGSILNPHYSYTYGNASGHNEPPSKIADEDSDVNYCYIKYFPSIFGDSVMVGFDLQYHLRPPADALTFSLSNSFADSIVHTSLNSGDMQNLFNPANIKRTREVDTYIYPHRGPWSYQDEEAFIYEERTIDNVLVSSAEYFLGWRGWVVRPTTINTTVNYRSDTQKRQYGYREGMAHHIENTTDYQPVDAGNHTATYRQNIYNHIAPDLLRAYIPASLGDIEALFYGWLFQRWHFLDKNYNKLGELQLGYDYLDYNGFLADLLAAVNNEAKVIELYFKYKDNELDFDPVDGVILQTQQDNRLVAETALEQHVFYNDFASIPLIYYCLKTRTQAVDHYVIMDDQDAMAA